MYRPTTDSLCSALARTELDAGAVHLHNHQLDESLDAYTSAQKLLKGLTLTDGDQFQPDIAEAYYRLGHFYSVAHRLDELLSIPTLKRWEYFQDLVRKGSKLYLSYVATTLNDLGLVQSANQHPLEAAADYKEALRSGAAWPQRIQVDWQEWQELSTSWAFSTDLRVRIRRQFALF